MMEPVEFKEYPYPQIDNSDWALTGAKGRNGRVIRSYAPLAENQCEFLEKLYAKYRAIEENETEWEEIGTEELVIAVLKKIGCQPETNEEGHIVFKYQGDDFYIAVEDEARFIMIWNPWWASISIENPALPYLKEIVNLVNVESLVTTIYTADEDEKNVGLHSKCHTLFTPKEGPLDEYLKAMLDHFFITHDSIKENLQQLSNAASESDKQERVKVKGFAAYKDNSTPLPVDDKQ